MKFWKDRSLYEEIEPGPRGNNRNKIIKYTTGTILLTAVYTIAAVLLSPAKHAEISEQLLQQSPKELPDLLVETDKGTVRGFRRVSRRGREFLAFRGIPFAKPPLGELRFQPPEDNEPWEGVLNTTEFRPECLQVSKGTGKGSEDCLHLNVYTPKKYEELENRKKLPVMVYIHGGGPSGDSRRNTGEYFMDEDVVLVGMNYRLCVFGNLNTNDSSARGNQGLRDQIKALEWVKANIENFGGDPKRVTLFGNSYGSMAIATHLLSPMTKGLFHQYICQSGHAIFPDHIQQIPLDYARAIAESVNCSIATSTELVDCLRNTDGPTLAVNARGLTRIGGNGIAISSNVFTTTVDPVLDGVEENDVYLPDMPLKLLQSGRTKAMPAMIGVNSGEGIAQSTLILSIPMLTEAINTNWEAVAIDALTLTWSPNAGEFVNEARELYFGHANISEDTRDNLTDLFSDRLGIHPAHVSADYQMGANSGGRRRRNDVYLYYFSHEVPQSYATPLPNMSMSEEEQRAMGPAHADELQFLFPYPPFPLVPLDSPNANFSQMMVHLWTTFAATGKRELSEGSDLWRPINQKPYGWFELNDEPKMIDFLAERMEFWDSFNQTDLYV